MTNHCAGARSAAAGACALLWAAALLRAAGAGACSAAAVRWRAAVPAPSARLWPSPAAEPHTAGGAAAVRALRCTSDMRRRRAGARAAADIGLGWPYPRARGGGRASAAKLGPLRKARRLCSAGGSTRVRIWLTVSSVSFRMPLVHDTRICARAPPLAPAGRAAARGRARRCERARNATHRHRRVMQPCTCNTLNTGQTAGSRRPAATWER